MYKHRWKLGVRGNIGSGIVMKIICYAVPVCGRALRGDAKSIYCTKRPAACTSPGFCSGSFRI